MDKYWYEIDAIKSDRIIYGKSIQINVMDNYMATQAFKVGDNVIHSNGGGSGTIVEIDKEMVAPNKVRWKDASVGWWEDNKITLIKQAPKEQNERSESFKVGDRVHHKVRGKYGIITKINEDHIDVDSEDTGRNIMWDASYLELASAQIAQPKIKFQVGDRVQINKNTWSGEGLPKGTNGTIDKLKRDKIWTIKFDNGHYQSFHEDNLIQALPKEQSFKVGDIVKVNKDIQKFGLNDGDEGEIENPNGLSEHPYFIRFKRCGWWLSEKDFNHIAHIGTSGTTQSLQIDTRTPEEMLKAKQSDCVSHSWKLHKGLNEKWDYCLLCDVKR